MQEEVENRTLTLLVSGTKVQAVDDIITKYLTRKEKSYKAEKLSGTPVKPRTRSGRPKQLISQKF